MGNDILKKIKNYIEENKRMSLKIVMEQNTSIITTEDADTRENYILNFLNPHDLK